MLSFSFKIANVEEKVKDNLSVKPYTLFILFKINVNHILGVYLIV